MPANLTSCLILAATLAWGQVLDLGPYVVGGILLVVGVAPRLAALGIAIAMVVALLTVKRGEGYFGTYFQQLILAASVSVMIAGSGALSIMRSGPRAT